MSIFYTKIKEQIHPSNSKIFIKRFNCNLNEYLNECIDIFKSFIQNIKYDISATGTWKLIESNNVLNFDEKDKIINFLNDKLSTGLSFGRIQNNLEIVKNKILCDFETWKDLSTEKKIFFNEIGNDYYLELNHNNISYKVSPNSCRHNYEAERIKNIIHETKNYKKIILEIGGGYGGLIFQYSNLINSNNFCWINIDLPKQLFLTYFYLKKSNIFVKNGLKIKFLNQNEKITKELTDNYNVILGVQEQIKDIMTKIDILVNFNSLSEMHIDTNNFYINAINKLDINYIYHQNSNYDIFPNSIFNHQEIIASKFNFNKNIYKLKLVNICPWLEGSGRYREYFYKRII